MEMFLVNLRGPAAAIKTIDVEVKVCPKTVWAIDKKGRRHLVGSSIFQTLAAAERCRTALLQTVVASTWTRNMKPWTWKAAKAALATLH